MAQAAWRGARMAIDELQAGDCLDIVIKPARQAQSHCRA
jgi:hypothetical protein